MSAVSRVAVVPFWEYAAFAVNSMVFLLVGIEIANLSVRAGIEAIAIAICVVLASRAVSIYCLSTVLNLRNKFIPRDWQHVLVWSGLRGALSMAMVIGLENTMPERDLQHG